MGFFIVLEGLDHSGKTTFAKDLSTILNKHNLKFDSTFEPGSGPLGKALRPILLNSKFKIDKTSELLLFLSDRYQHLHSSLLPAIKTNDVVICDRFFYSSFVYQGFIKGVKWDLIFNMHEQLNLFALKPDLVIFFSSIFDKHDIHKKNNSFFYENLDHDRFCKLFKSDKNQINNLLKFHKYYHETFQRLSKYTKKLITFNRVTDNREENLKKVLKLIFDQKKPK